ncbi:organic cation transporter protein-like [Oppia nitens]|uniref:organic cation transporter protein-like n=1 Tax=Oppia nitens TaxID=1686743 RepID=UPI0023DA63E9|nr:organic cation transporter protein-like [Oppia nitens]
MKSAPIKTSVQQVSDIIGDWGLWQLNIVVFSISIQLFLAFHTLAVSFYAPTIDYKCTDNDITSTTTTTTSANNETNDYYCLNGCKNWTFDRSVFKSTIIDEWQLVCDRQGLASLSQSLFMLGFALGAVIFSYLSDRFGRLPILWITVILEILAGLSSGLAMNVTQFNISRVILGMVSNGNYLTTFMMVNECVAPKYRSTFSVCIQMGWTAGYCLLPGIAYLLPDFRQLILATTIPQIVWLVWLYWIPESPRWLIAHQKWDRLELVVKQAVHMNSLPINDFDNQFESLKKSIVNNNEECVNKQLLTNDNNNNINTNNNNNKTKSSLWSVMQSPNLRRTTLIMYFTWFVNSFVYFGISLNIGDLGGNLFINFLVAGLIEFPSFIFPIVAFKYIGRRPLIGGYMLLNGLSCFAVIPCLAMTAIWPRVTIAMIGKSFITSSFSVIYVYAAEVYPTVVRQVGVGSCSVAARVGSMLAPFVKDLNIYTGMSVVLSIYGSLSIADAVAAYFLPETRGQPIADTIDEAEQLNRRHNSKVAKINDKNKCDYKLHVITDNKV